MNSYLKELQRILEHNRFSEERALDCGAHGIDMECFGGVGLYLESEGPDDDGDEVGGERDWDR